VLKHIRTKALWMAVGLVLGGGALSFAATTAPTHSHGPKPHASVSESPEPTETETEAPETDNKGSTDANRPENHGFFVSLAAQCKDVNDTTNNITFTAPADCATNGQAHGKYVSSVAQSDAGKGAHGHGHDSSSK
jgi:hypothetical protein